MVPELTISSRELEAAFDQFLDRFRKSGQEELYGAAIVKSFPASRCVRSYCTSISFITNVHETSQECSAHTVASHAFDHYYNASKGKR